MFGVSLVLERIAEGSSGRLMTSISVWYPRGSPPQRLLICSNLSCTREYDRIVKRKTSDIGFHLVSEGTATATNFCYVRIFFFGGPRAPRSKQAVVGLVLYIDFGEERGAEREASNCKFTTLASGLEQA